MPDTGLWLRVFVGLFLAAILPVLLLASVIVLAYPLVVDAEPSLVAVAVVIGTMVWASMLAVVYTRPLADDLRAFRSLAARGERVDIPEPGTAYRQVVDALTERDRQVATLARGTSTIPIDEEPRHVVGSLVTMVRSVLNDPTWRWAILVADDNRLLPPAVYPAMDDEAEPRPIGDLERWASVNLADSEEPVGLFVGPWGAFATVEVAVSDRLRGILYAPWEGRPEPTPAEVALLTIVGQHAGTALEHSILYARVRLQADELNRLAAVQADFLRGVTHDLQTPLTSIRALATELRAELPLSGSARIDLDTIAHQAERLRRMVSQLLVASRLEAGALTPQVEVFSVLPLVERTWKALRADNPFEVIVDGKPHLAVADPDRAEQVLWALLDNAVKYSPAGSPISVRIVGGNGRLSVAVIDRGVGMDTATRSHAFDQFYRSGQARRLAPNGSGVGLYAARGLVEAMGGSVAIKSSLGNGTALTIILPAEVSTHPE